MTKFSLKEVVVCDWTDDQQYVAVISKLPTQEDAAANAEKYGVRWARFDDRTKEWVQCSQRNQNIAIEKVHKATPEKLNELRQADEEAHAQAHSHAKKADQRHPQTQPTRQDTLRPRRSTSEGETRTSQASGRRRYTIQTLSSVPESSPPPAKASTSGRKRKRTLSSASTLSTDQSDITTSHKREKTVSSSPRPTPLVSNVDPVSAPLTRDDVLIPSDLLDLELPFPDTLMQRLIEDWENITARSQLIHLPTAPTVHEILSKYRSSTVSESTSHFHHPSITNRPVALLDDFLQGLEDTFNTMLGQHLLYKFERLQYAELRYKDKDKTLLASKMYGAEHLLRLFCSIPPLIKQSTDPKTSAEVLDYCSDFLRFMRREQEELFAPQYQETTRGYQNHSRAGL